MERVPDLMLRFVTAPHWCVVAHGGGSTHIQTNDPDLTQAIAAVLRKAANSSPASFFTRIELIVDYSIGASGGHATIDDGDIVTVVEAAEVRVLLRGTATVLIYDRETRILTGFLASTLVFNELVDRLLPAVLM